MSTFGLISYAATAFLYALLVLLLVVSWRGRFMGGLFIGACVTSMCWAGMLAMQTASSVFPPAAIFVAEVLRSAAWLVFLGAVTSTIGVPLLVKVFVHLTWVGTLLAGLFVAFSGGLAAGSVSISSALIPGGLLIALAGLMLVEQLYRNSPADAQPAIKFLALGLGGLFAYDLFLYAEALLLESLDAAAWGVRGVVNALIVPLLTVSAQRNPRWDLDVFVSRQAVFFSTTLLVVGAYLLLMSLGGYFIVLYGGAWVAVLRIVFFFGAGVVLMLLLFSSSLRSQIKVLLVKHFFRNKYDYREEWLRLISTLSSAHERDTGTTLIKAVAQMVESPGGVLWRSTDRDSTFAPVASFNTDIVAPDLSPTDPLIEFMKKHSWLVDLEEYRLERDLYGDLVLPDWARGIDSAWLFVPLFSGARLRGIMLLLKPKSPPKLNYEDRDLLKTVGQHLAVHLAQEEADRLLDEAKQFEAYNRLTAFLMHDLKNLVAQQSLILKNAEKHRRNPEFIDDAMMTIANSVKRMNNVMEQLAREQKVSPARDTPVKYVVSNAIDRCDERSPVPSIVLHDPDSAVCVDPERFSMILQHLIRNAQDATADGGSIVVTVGRDAEFATVTIRDTGSGMTAEFIRDRLFRPFDSTKGSQGMGIGAHQAREFARERGGDVRVRSTLGAGTELEVRLPSS